MPNFTTLLYEKPEAHIARIWLNRPETRNAQDTHLLYELNDAFDAAMADDDVRVVILAAKGAHFSAGHDLRETDIIAGDRARKRVGTWQSGNWDGAEAYYCREKEIYEGFCRRWRNLAKPTIAAVQGKAIAGGLMLIWPCDFVIASDDASFQDNTMFMGIPGVEYFAHVWELGIRKAKEFLMGGQPLSAAEAQAAGMVNRVVPRALLEQETLAFARSIADKPSFALRLAKDAINAAFDAQGFETVQRAAFNAHHLAHTHFRLHQDGAYMDREFMQRFQSKTK
jgi:enoyl-CoA hydratase